MKDHVNICEITGTSEAITVNKIEDTIFWVYEISATVSCLVYMYVRVLIYVHVYLFANNSSTLLTAAREITLHFPPVHV